MVNSERLSDSELLARAKQDPESFGTFYRRHVHAVIRYHQSKTGDPETAADLTAETFAVALAAAGRHRSRKVTPEAWLFAIARNKLVDSYRRGQVEDRARRRLAMERLDLEPEDADFFRSQASREGEAFRAMSELSSDHRAVVVARVVNGRSYSEISSQMAVPEHVVRKRLSRALVQLRRNLKETS